MVPLGVMGLIHPVDEPADPGEAVCGIAPVAACRRGGRGNRTVRDRLDPPQVRELRDGRIQTLPLGVAEVPVEGDISVGKAPRPGVARPVTRRTALRR